jgi:hypothetical protein
MARPLKATAAMPCVEAAELMNQLSLGLMHGTVIIRSSEERHAYHLGQVIRLEIRAEEDGTDGSMHIGLHWRVPLSVTTSS